MAVITIDAKSELAELVAAQDGHEAPAEQPAETPAKPAEEPAPAGPDSDDVEGEDGLTARQKREYTQSMLKTIGKKHRERREAEEFAAAQYAERKLAEQRADSAERALAELKAKASAAPEAQPDPEAGKPTRDKFETDQAYWDAYVDWRAERKADQKLAEARAADAKAAEDRRAAEIMASAEARITKARTLVPDFSDVGMSADVMLSDPVRDYLLKSEMIAELTYHLAQHPAEAAKLYKLPLDEQLVTIGKIEGTLKPFEPQGSKASTTTNGATPSSTAANGHKAEPSETGSTPSRARSSAPVITPLNGNSGATVEKAPEDMNIREVIVDFQKRNKANLGLRKRH